MRLYEYDERSLLASIPICISECPSCLSRVIQSITFTASQFLDTYTTWQYKIEASDTFLLGYVGTCVASRAKQRNVLWLLHSFLE